MTGKLARSLAAALLLAGLAVPAMALPATAAGGTDNDHTLAGCANELGETEEARARSGADSKWDSYL